jgi:hypothetical protein
VGAGGDDLFDRGEDRAEPNGLDEDLVESCGATSGDIGGEGPGGKGDPAYCAVAAGFEHQIAAVTIGEQDVGEEHVELAGGDVPKGLGIGAGSLDLVAARFEDAAEDGSAVEMIFNE